MLTAEETTELLSKIAELGGKSIKEEDIVYEGTKMVVPEQWRGDLKKAIKFLNDKIKEDDEKAEFVRVFKYRPYDGAICAYRAMKKAFGFVHGKATPGFFSMMPPEYIQVQVSVEETEEVPWGMFSVPLIENTEIHFLQTLEPEMGRVFQIIVESPRKNRFLIEGLFRLVEEELQNASIYRGKAIDGQQDPHFLDLRSLDSSKVVYSEQVQADLDAHIWSVMRYTKQHQSLGLPLKRSVLLYGPYGTGKTLAGYLTARVATDNEWTFIMARPGRDNFLEVMQTARLYQPAIVFFEDAEIVTASEQANASNISKVLDVFDGINTKGTSMMVVMTTNHPENIHKAMHRPGRVDAQIEIGPLDSIGIQNLIQRTIPEHMLQETIDWEEVSASCDGYVPAFVKEVADRAIRYSLSRSHGSIGTDAVKIQTEDLVKSAQGLRPQFNRMSSAEETHIKNRSLEEIVVSGISGIISASPRADVWNPNELKKLGGG